MNNIDYNQAGGFPLSTQILDAAQTAYKNFNAYGNLAGELAIITGCEPASGGTVTDGFVSIYGELLPFLGNTITDNVIIIETPDARGFEDGSVKAVIYARYATFGDATISYPWENFRRPKTLFQLEDRLTQLEAAVPIGLVAIWDRPADAIPQYWVEHIDLSGKVPAGYQNGDVNFGNLGGDIGTSQVTLTKAQLPNIRLKTMKNNQVNGYGVNGEFASIKVESGGNSNYFITGTNAEPDVYGTSPLGNGESHSNIQPSRIVKFIRFVGFE